MRRMVLTLFAAAGALAAASAPIPSEAAPARHRAPLEAAASPVTVDVSRLRELGLGATADLIRAALTDELAREPLPGSGHMIVRITGLSLNAYAGGDSGGGGSDGSGGGAAFNNDFLEGEILVVGPGGQILSRRPQLVVSPASSGGPSYLEGSERRRVVLLARQFAAWLHRGTG